MNNSAITSMQQQEQHIESLQTIITDLQTQIQALHKPQLMYRPPESEEHELITDYLDKVEMRLRKLEENSHKAPRTNHGKRLDKLETSVWALENPVSSFAPEESEATKNMKNIPGYYDA